MGDTLEGELVVVVVLAELSGEHCEVRVVRLGLQEALDQNPNDLAVLLRGERKP